MLAMLLAIAASALALAPSAATANKAYAVSNTLTAAASSSSVRYIAILGADTWTNGDGSHHMPASDLTAIARVDTSKGVVSILTIPRDLQYKNMKKVFPNATNYGANMVFYYAFQDAVQGNWEANYSSAVQTAAKASCKMLSSMTGLSVSDYAVVDLYTYQDLISELGGVTVNIPVGIKDYRLYSNGQYYSVNNGKIGKATLDSWDAMIASRAREPYTQWVQGKGYTLRYDSLSDYTGSVPQILIHGMNSDGTTASWYRFDGDGTRQFLNRRTFGMLINKGLDRGEGAWNFVWNTLVDGGLMWTNLSQSDVTTIGKALAKAKKAGTLTMYGASAVSPEKGKRVTVDGTDQWMIPMDSTNAKVLKATVKQFKAGTRMTKGFGAETVIGLAKGEKAKSAGVTYKALNAKAVTVVSVPNKRSVSIPATVTLNNKKFKVTAVSAKSMKGSKVRTVTLGANITKIAANAFNGSKAKTLALKTTLLKKAKVKGSLAGSKITKIKVQVAKASKKATVKSYKKIFAKSNAKGSKTPTVS